MLDESTDLLDSIDLSDVSDFLNDSDLNQQSSLDTNPHKKLLDDSLRLYMRHNLTLEAYLDVLKLLQAYPGNTFSFPVTKYKLFQTFPGSLNIFNHVKCSACNNYTEHSSNSELYFCSRCQKEMNPKKNGFFQYISFKAQLSQQIKKHWTSINEHMTKSDEKRNNLRDCQDGRLYVKMNTGSQDVRLGFMLNTDGANKFRSNSKSIWPILLVQLYLPPETRYKRENIILVAIHYGKKPEANSFFTPLTNDLNDLHRNGLKLSINNEQYCFKPYIFSVCCDLPAKAMVQNINQFNGYFACGFCYHPGCAISTCTKNSGNRKFVRYTENHNETRRTEESSLKDMQCANQSTDPNFTSRGIKGISVAVGFPLFNVVDGYCIDYMHCVLLGVVSKVIDLWLNSKYNSQDFYIKPNLRKALNARITSLRPTSNISRLPRSLDEYKSFKANEIRSLLLFYMPICADGIQNTKYLRHFQLLSSSVYTLLETNITTDKLNETNTNLQMFVKDFELLYGKQNMVMNIHLLKHLVDACINLGPLWCQSAFAFEDFNGLLLKYIKGPNDVLLQISSKYVLAKTYLKFNDNTTAMGNAIVLGRPKKLLKPTTHDPNDEHYGEAEAFRKPAKTLNDLLHSKYIWAYQRLKLNEKIYTSTSYKRAIKTIDYFVGLSDGHFGIIKYYLNGRDGLYAMIEQFRCSTTRDQFQEVENLNYCTIFPVNSIQNKYIYLKLNNKNFIVEAPNSFEKD